MTVFSDHHSALPIEPNDSRSTSQTRTPPSRVVTIVAVTNNLVAEQEDKLRHTRLRNLFDELVISEAAGVHKPDPAIFDLALRAARATPAEAVMLGDSWENDVMGAIRAGIAAAWLDRRAAGVPSSLAAPLPRR